MIIISKGRIFNRAHIWFEQIDALDDLKRFTGRYDVVTIHGNAVPIQGESILNIWQSSLITDLSAETDILWKKMTKTLRNEINRCKKENIEVEFLSSGDVLERPYMLDTFSTVYQSMYAQKGFAGHKLNTNELISYANKDCLVISLIKYEDRPIVFHSYIIDGAFSRLLQSCSEFRANDSETKKAYGRANKYLHWNDFMWLKNKGIVSYDWGGVSSFEEPNGIDIFKMNFGPERIQYVNCTYVKSLKMKIYNKIRRTC